MGCYRWRRFGDPVKGGQGVDPCQQGDAKEFSTQRRRAQYKCIDASEAVPSASDQRTRGAQEHRCVKLIGKVLNLERCKQANRRDEVTGSETWVVSKYPSGKSWHCSNSGSRQYDVYVHDMSVPSIYKRCLGSSIFRLGYMQE